MNVKIGQHYIDFDGDVCKILDIKDNKCSVWWVSLHPELTESEIKTIRHLWSEEETELWELCPLYNSPLYEAMQEDD